MATDTDSKLTPEYDPTDATGNSKEIARADIIVPLEDDPDPARKERAREVLEGFEGEAVRPPPDGF